MNNTELIRKLKDKITSNTKWVIETLLQASKMLNDTDFENKIILQASFYSDIQENEKDNTVSHENLTIQKAKLKKALLSYIDELAEFEEIDIEEIIKSIENDKSNAQNEYSNMNLQDLKQIYKKKYNHSLHPDFDAKKEKEKVLEKIAQLTKKTPERKKIIYLDSRANDFVDLKCTNEIEIIQNNYNSSGNAQNNYFEPIFQTNVKKSKMYENLALPPAAFIVHLSCHGEDDDGLVFKGEKENEYVYANDINGWLDDLAKFNKKPTCLLISACFSEQLFDEIGYRVEFLIGMSKAIDSTNAIKFANDFYKGLFIDNNIEEGFRNGIRNLKDEIKEIPVLYINGVKK